MSCLFSERGRCFPLVLGIALACVLAAGARAAGQRGRPIEFSAPGSEATATNGNQPGPNQLQDESLRRKLEEDLLGSSGIFGDRNSLGGVAVEALRPPVSPPVRNKRVKDLLERRKNWAFMTPDDFKNEPTLEELLKLQKYDRDGQEEKDQSSVERYYDSLDRKQPGGTNRLANRFADRQDNRKDDDFLSSDIPARREDPLQKTENKLKDVFNSDSTSALSSGGSGGGVFSGLFGSAQTLPVEQTLAQRARMEEFKQLLEPRFPLAPPAALANPLNPQFGLPYPVSGLGVQPSSAVPLFGGANAGVGGLPGASPGLNLPSSGLSSFAPAPPVEPARVAPPLLSIPKRKF